MIAHGGTSDVFEAVDDLGHAGALKMLRDELRASTAWRERFELEGRIVGRINHASIPKVFDRGVSEDGAPYVVMRILDGEPLSAVLERDPAPWTVARVARFGLRLLDVLAAVHAAGVVHCDLKPGNIVVTPEGEIRLLDFGIAFARDEAARNDTWAGLVMGTPGYMPPEQARADWDRVDARSDLWAVGALLYRLLTGHRVLAAETPRAMIRRAASERVPRTADAIPDAPAMTALLDRALAAEPAERVASAAAMAEELEAVLQELEEPPPASKPSRLRRLARMLRIPLVAVGLAVPIVALAACHWLAESAPDDGGEASDGHAVADDP